MKNKSSGFFGKKAKTQEKAKLYSEKDKRGSLLFSGIIMLLLGGGFFVAPFIFETLRQDSLTMYATWGLAVVLVLVSILSFHQFSVKNKELKAKDGKDDKKAEEKKEKKKKNKKYDDVIYVEEMEIDASQLDLESNKPQIIQPKKEEPVIQYIPQQSVFQFMNAGTRQPMEEKFQQIYHMDHSQFVMYVARLFAARGFVVKLTPVVDNHGIDMVVERDKSSFAVTCINRHNKLVSKEDVEYLANISKLVQVKEIMILTSSYFDRSALDFIRAKKFSAVDRTILEEDFINAVDFKR